eukprot:TRINITY_DN8183_c0_g1_i2.p1 TRINITY_DN8183_c0_g1~~TRINITY_DN8183_c0_g1_i2.p1  ORF type:complete len:789 (+),score=158.08 TRINITY_DN8183_c0_g1_i2:154-2520(+)
MEMETPRILDYYTLGKEIGKGSFSSVVVGHHKRTGGYFAVKIVPKAEISSRQLDRIYQEIEILSSCRHPNIVNLVEYFDEDKIYLVTELKTGGELFDRILEKGSYKEPEARNVLKQIGVAVQYLHTHGIVHRDLKPENMLFDSMAPDSPLCIADFGFARFIATNELLLTPCGTPGYVAPEIANAGHYDKGVDMWSLGVIMYTLLCGFPPFFSEDDDELLEMVSTGEYSFPEPFWDGISSEARELIGHLLQTDPTRRYTAEQFLQHPWFQMGTRLSVALPDPAIAEVSATFATLMSPTARAFLAGANGPAFPSPDASPSARRPSAGSTGPLDYGAARRLSNSSSDAGMPRRLSSGDPSAAVRRLSIGGSGWHSAGAHVPPGDPSGSRRFSVSGSGAYPVDPPVPRRFSNAAALTVSSGSIGVFGIPFGAGYASYLTGGGSLTVSSGEISNESGSASSLRASARSAMASRAFPLGPTTPPGEFSAYAQALGFDSEMGDDTLRAQPPPPLDPSSSEEECLSPVFRENGHSAPSSNSRAGLMSSNRWPRPGELTSSGECATDGASSDAAVPLSPPFRSRPPADRLPLYRSIDDIPALASMTPVPEPMHDNVSDLPCWPIASTSMDNFSASATPPVARSALAISLEMPFFSGVSAPIDEPIMPTPTLSFGLRVSTDLAYPNGRSRASSMLGNSCHGPVVSPPLVSPTSPASPSVEQKQLISVLSKTISALRDGVVLRAPSESTVWRQRQRKRSGPPLPSDAQLLGSSPKTLRASASDLMSRDRLVSSSDEESA